MVRKRVLGPEAIKREHSGKRDRGWGDQKKAEPQHPWDAWRGHGGQVPRASLGNSCLLGLSEREHSVLPVPGARWGSSPEVSPMSSPPVYTFSHSLVSEAVPLSSLQPGNLTQYQFSVGLWANAFSLLGLRFLFSKLGHCVLKWGQFVPGPNGDTWNVRIWRQGALIVQKKKKKIKGVLPAFSAQEPSMLNTLRNAGRFQGYTGARSYKNRSKAILRFAALLNGLLRVES